MEANENFTQPEATYDPREFQNKFLIMDYELSLVSHNLNFYQSKGDVEKFAPLFAQKKAMIKHMLEYVASAYYISNARVRLLPIFDPLSEEYAELAFPYKGQKLWDIITNKAPHHSNEEPETQTTDNLARAITLRVEQLEQDDS